MSFAKMVKEELATINKMQDEQLSELAAFMHLNVELEIKNHEKMLWFKTTNPTVARRFLTLVKTLYKTDATLMTSQEHNFKKKNSIHIGIKENVDQILSEHDLFYEQENLELLTQTVETKTAYLRGCFLSSGSVNHPKTGEYHLEIYSDNPTKMVFIQRLMNEFNLNAKITQRRNGYIAYLKEAECIADFLRYIGAVETVFLYDDIRIKRDFNNSINRVINMELANEKKVIQAASEQIEDIEIIEKKIDLNTLSDKIIKAMNLRKKYPDTSLSELTTLYLKEYQETISKSGLNHRYMKIKELANQVRNDENGR
ncbi:Sporulation regulator WhiA family protein [Alteracholeplasma palmae J233]|uniref:Probable cell division protein WhiA n=1 Tax=Alteracholeplasma palmae (strain ATCC 49389 / J233) TaxID=1318466 RepID=U4KJL6_ALTPJ|nr:DNA-binding protein WhiA [Alteracholeplasma palmae]CCV63714.1 Sporulation regulator WhiA family protein [Alteracholeplasma palmae J233]